jgi:hypothetical protein
MAVLDPDHWIGDEYDTEKRDGAAMDLHLLTVKALLLLGQEEEHKPKNVPAQHLRAIVERLRHQIATNEPHTGPPIPAVQSDRSGLLITEWAVAGPFTQLQDQIAQNPERHTSKWRPFGPHTVAYFRTRVRSQLPRRAELRLSTVDDLAIWCPCNSIREPTNWWSGFVAVFMRLEAFSPRWWIEKPAAEERRR